MIIFSSSSLNETTELGAVKLTEEPAPIWFCFITPFLFPFRFRNDVVILQKTRRENEKISIIYAWVND